MPREKLLDITIRSERPDDYKAILRLTYEAFLTLDYPGRRRLDEHYLISLLRDSSYVIPQLCFVAEYKGGIIGHILYTKSGFKRPDGSRANTITFGPLSVLPKFQCRGVGAALVRHSMEKARELGHKAVLITGVPEYYPKLGFKRAREYDLSLNNSYTELHAVGEMNQAEATAPDAFMAYELAPGYLAGGGVYDSWAPEFDRAENDDAGYEAFHLQFIEKGMDKSSK